MQLLGPRLLPAAASQEAVTIDDAFLILLRVVVPILTFVVVAVVYSMLSFRGRSGEASPVQRRDDARFSWSWFAGTSAATVLVIVYPGVTGLRAIWAGNGDRGALRVDVTASQWEWSFDYPQLGVEGAETLVLPAGRRVRFVLRSPDVIHSFWVPAFRVKQDIVPGEARVLVVETTRPISTAVSPLARVQCAELCGIGHPEMRAALRVVPKPAFEAWVAGRSRRAAGAMR